MTCFPSGSQLRSFYDSLHGESRICLSHHRENGNRNTDTKTTRQENSVTSERQTTHSDPSRIQSNIPETLGTLMNVTWLMTAKIGLSKTQSQESWHYSTQQHSRLTLLHDAANPGQFKGYVEWTSSWKIKTSYSLFMHPDIRQNNPLQGWINPALQPNSSTKIRRYWFSVQCTFI